MSRHQQRFQQQREIASKRAAERDPFDVREASAHVWIIARIIEGRQMYLAKDGYWVAFFYEALAYPSPETAGALAQRHNGMVMKLYFCAVPIANAPMSSAGPMPGELEG